MNADLAHAPTDDTADGRTRCVVDQYRWPCPAVRQQPEALLPGGEVLADEVGIGWSIWRRTPPGASYVPEGGCVVDVRDEEHDDDAIRVYRVLVWRGARPDFVEIRSGDFDPLMSNLPNTTAMRAHARRLAAHVGKEKGIVSPFELDLARCALRLYERLA